MFGAGSFNPHDNRRPTYGAAGGASAPSGMRQMRRTTTPASAAQAASIMSDEEDKEEIMPDYEPADDEEAAYMEAFPDNNWDADKMAAFKEGIRLCVVKNMEGGYEEESAPKEGETDLALILGAPKKKG